MTVLWRFVGSRATELNGQWGELLGSGNDGMRLKLRLQFDAMPSIMIRPDNVTPLPEPYCTVFRSDEREVAMRAAGLYEADSVSGGSDCESGADSSDGEPEPELIGSIARDEVIQSRG